MNRAAVRFSVAAACACITVLLTSACTVTRFTMQQEASLPVRTVVLSPARTVHRSHTNAFEMIGPAKVGMRAERVTHGRFSMEVTRSSASPLTLQLRSTPHEDSVLHRKGVVITIAGDSTAVETAGSRVVFTTPLPIGKPYVVEVGNFGHRMLLRVGHTDCGVLRTTLPCTEWVIASTSDSSRVVIGDPWFDLEI